MIETEIVNAVATASLDQPVDFEELRQFKEIFYDSDVYGGRVAYFKTGNMQGRVSIFLSGKMISVGTKSETQAFKELEIAKQFLVKRRLVKPVRLQPKTQNLVVTANFQQIVSLEHLAQSTKAIYEPEQFPGAILRLKDPFKTSILVFSSGKVVITGLKSSKHVEPIIVELKKIIESNL